MDRHDHPRREPLVTISVLIPLSLLEQCDTVAERMGAKRATALRELIRAGLREVAASKAPTPDEPLGPEALSELLATVGGTEVAS